MATNFPTSLDALTNPTSSSALNSPDHAGQHSDANDAIEALEAKVGVNGSAVTTSLDYKITNGVLPTLNVDSGVLVVDATNNRVGVNTATPGYALEVNGSLQAGSIGSGGSLNVLGTANLGTVDAVGTVTAHSSSTRDGVQLAGRAGGSSSLNSILTPTTLTANRTLTLPDASGTVALSSATNGDLVSPYTGFRNAIINGDFRINQRAWSSTSGSGGSISGTYGFDRWQLACSGGTETMSKQTFTVGSPAATGYESENYLRVTTSGQSGTTDYCCPSHYIEDVRTLANSTITVSFWAKASSGTPKVAVDLVQTFGSGGSPSADVTNYAGQVTLSTSWARYSVTYTMPNINGKTIGTTANTSAIRLLLWVSAGSTFNARTGSIGIQNNTFDFWGVQVERGSSATPFEQRLIGAELVLCRRYYEKSYPIPTAPGTNTGDGLQILGLTSDSSGNASTTIRFTTPKRNNLFGIGSYTLAGTSGYWSYVRSGASGDTATTAINLSENGFRFYHATGANFTAVSSYGHWVADNEF